MVGALIGGLVAFCLITLLTLWAIIGMQQLMAKMRREGLDAEMHFQTFHLCLQIGFVSLVGAVIGYFIAGG